MIRPIIAFTGWATCLTGQVSSCQDVVTNHHTKRTNQRPASGLKKSVPAAWNPYSKMSVNAPIRTNAKMPFVGWEVFFTGQNSYQKTTNTKIANQIAGTIPKT